MTIVAERLCAGVLAGVAVTIGVAGSSWAAGAPAAAPAALSAGPVAPAAVADEVAMLQRKPTPRRGGRPDLSGNWFSGTGTVPPFDFETTRAADGSIQTRTVPGQFNFRTVTDPTASAQPQYKPEFVERVKASYANLTKLDRAYSCGQPGLPRVGAPQKVVQTPEEIVFLYADIAGMVWRVVPLNRRPTGDNEPSYYGDAFGRWEGDSLVVETNNFSDETWFGEFGYFHSDQMRVVERFTRRGDTIVYAVTVIDPGVLTAPFVKPPQVITKSNVELAEPPPCRIDPNREDPNPQAVHAQRF